VGTEALAFKAAKDTTRQAVGAVEAMVKKAWSVLEAAAEKQSPSEYLSPRAVSAIQGKGQP
jgi:hypothetical protein